MLLLATNWLIRVNYTNTVIITKCFFQQILLGITWSLQGVYILEQNFKYKFHGIVIVVVIVANIWCLKMNATDVCKYFTVDTFQPVIVNYNCNTI